MPSKKKASSGGIPKSILADLNRVKTRLSGVEKDISRLRGELKNSSKSFTDSLKKHQSTLQSSIASLGKRGAKKAKRKPSEYNLFLKDKMSSGMSMVDAVKAWKEKGGSETSMSSTSSSMRDTSTEWQSPSQEES